MKRVVKTPIAHKDVFKQTSIISVDRFKRLQKKLAQLKLENEMLHGKLEEISKIAGV